MKRGKEKKGKDKLREGEGFAREARQTESGQRKVKYKQIHMQCSSRQRQACMHSRLEE